MKYNLKRLLALVMALMLAIPSFAFAEDDELVIMEDADYSVISDESDDLVEEVDEIVEEVQELDLGELTPEEEPLEDPAEAETDSSPAFEQTLDYDGLHFTVKADAGVVDEGATIGVTKVDIDADVINAAQALGVDGVHSVYGIYVFDGAFMAGLPIVRVEGVGEDARVVSYDYDHHAKVIDVSVDGNAVEFALDDVLAYDIVTAAQEEAEPTEEPVPEEIVIDESVDDGFVDGASTADTSEDAAAGEQTAVPAEEAFEEEAVEASIEVPADPDVGAISESPAEPDAGVISESPESEPSPLEKVDQPQAETDEVLSKPAAESPADPDVGAISESPEPEPSPVGEGGAEAPDEVEEPSDEPVEEEPVVGAISESPESETSPVGEGGAEAPDEVEEPVAEEPSEETPSEDAEQQPAEDAPGTGMPTSDENGTPETPETENTEENNIEEPVVEEPAEEPAEEPVEGPVEEPVVAPAVEESVVEAEPVAEEEELPIEEPVEDELIAEQPVKMQSAEEEQPEISYPAFSEYKTVDKVWVTVSAPEGVFPAGASLVVLPVAQESAEARNIEAAVQEKRDEKTKVAVSYTFDIKVVDKDGNEIEPTDAGKVKVSFRALEVLDANLETQVYHVSEDDGELVAESLDVKERGIIATVETDSFSWYQVEFTYDEIEYVLPGNEAVALSTILNAVGITGSSIEGVRVTDENLFYAYVDPETGAWFVKANNAFTSTEYMWVTVDGIEYEIVVTDGRLDVATVAYADGEGYQEYTTLEAAIAAVGTEHDGALLGTTIELTKGINSLRVW